MIPTAGAVSCSKTDKLYVILFSAWSLQSVLGAENEGDNPIEWLKNSIPGSPATSTTTFLQPT